jgi:hypothetical protein
LVAEADVLFGGLFVFMLILVVFLFASIRTVREGEFMAVFRLGRAASVLGPGLGVVIPLVDKTVRVDVPVGMASLGVARNLPRTGKATSSQEVPGHPGLTISEACLRAAMLVRQRNPKARRATVEQFQEALRDLAGKEERKAW